MARYELQHNGRRVSERRPLTSSSLIHDVRVVHVRFHGMAVGEVAPTRGRFGIYEFRYSPSFARSELELSPLYLPLHSEMRYSFPSLKGVTFHGLPGLLADALPDKFGNVLINEYFIRQGTALEHITALQRLLYVGRRAMGALEFEPTTQYVAAPSVCVPLEMADVVEDTRRVLRGESAQATQTIIDVGSAAGGARAKAMIGWNPKTRAIVSGQFDLPDGFEHWLLKFDVGPDGILGYSAGFGRIEYAHYLMAIEAGIEMSECRLLEENGRAHFMTRRFDRIGNQKVHMHTLCGLAHLDYNTPYLHSYEQYLRTVLNMKLGPAALEQAWLRCAFNFAVVNCDDHPKNFAFLMDGAGRWGLSPAYDNCFAHNPSAGKWPRQHQMLLAGKAWDVTDTDLLTLADKFGVRQARALIQRVTAAVMKWPTFARRAGVPEADIRRVASFHPVWVQR